MLHPFGSELLKRENPNGATHQDPGTASTWSLLYLPLVIVSNHRFLFNEFANSKCEGVETDDMTWYCLYHILRREAKDSMAK
jgi:hypothetical protein